MRDNTYVVIQSFMLKDLHLKGNELIVYAVIYGYTQDGEHWYYGTRAHLAEWCGATKGTVSNCLSSLIEKGFIERREVKRPGYTEVQYRAKNCDTLPKIRMGGSKNYDGGVSNFATVNKIDNNKTYKGVEEKYPEKMKCECGGDMLRTATSQSGTGKPYYRCEKCNEERLPQ